MYLGNPKRNARVKKVVSAIRLVALPLVIGAVSTAALAGENDNRHSRTVIKGADLFDTTQSGYQYNTDLDGFSAYVETTPDVGFHLSNESGATCRTGVVANRSTVIHRGQGDAISSVDYALSMSSGAVGNDWLSWPAVSSGGSDTVAAVPRTYLNVIERNIKDRGNDDVAAIGGVANYILTGPRKALAPRGHDLLQSKGGPLDFGYQIAGKVNRGLDLTRMQSPDEAAIVLKEGQRVYFASTAQGNIQDTKLGDTYLTFRNGSFQFVINGKTVMTIN